MAPATVAEVLETRGRELMALPRVVGVAEGRTDDDVPCVLLMLASAPPEDERVYPERIDGHPVRLHVSGPFEARGV